MEIEVDYIATFANMDDAVSYVASRGHDVEPELIVDDTESAETEETVPQTETESSRPAVTPHTVSRQTEPEDSGEGSVATDAAKSSDSSVSPWVFVAVAAIVAAIVIAIIVIKKKK